MCQEILGLDGRFLQNAAGNRATSDSRVAELVEGLVEEDSFLLGLPDNEVSIKCSSVCTKG